MLSNIFTETAFEIVQAYRVVVASKGIEEKTFRENLNVFAAADDAIKAAIADARTNFDVPPPKVIKQVGLYDLSGENRNVS